MKIYELILYSILIACLIMVGYVLNPLVSEISDTNELITIDDYKNCSNLSVNETTKCLVNYVNYIYNYTVRDDIDRTLEDIKSNGGDCYDYSKLYEKMAISLGLNSETYAFYGSSGHRFAIIYDYEMTEYCQIDMLNYVCRRFT